MKTLVIEDCSIEQKVIKRRLEKEEIASEIMFANNGKEALNYFQSSDMVPELVTVDLNMPIMNGFEFLEELTKTPHEITDKIKILIVLTSSTNPKDIQRLQSYPLVKYVMNKPLDHKTLSQALRD